MPLTKVKPLGPLLSGGEKKTSAGSPIEYTGAPNLQTPGRVAPTPIGAGGGGSSKKKPKKEEDDITRPSETWQPDYSSHDTSNVLDPLNPDNYEWNPDTGQFDSKLKKPTDPANWAWDREHNVPVYT